MRLVVGLLAFALAALARGADVRAADGDIYDPKEGHPEPRVIVDVLKVAGPHDRDDLERDARRLLWGKIVSCYKPAAHLRPKLRGEVVLKLRAGAHGDVSSVRKVRATLPDAGVVGCWSKRVREISLPRASRASDVTIQIHIAPGDAPV
jgi:hypothetical protein